LKNLIIFLHGKGVKPTDLRYKHFDKLAGYFNATIVPIVAPHTYRGAFRWHNGNKQSLDEARAEFTESMTCIESETRKILAGRKLDYSDVIWLGHSQGGDMAIRQAMLHGAKRVVVFSADISPLFPLPPGMHKDFPIDWIEAEHDDVLSETRRDSYKILQGMGMKVNRIISPKSTHDNFNLQDFFDSITPR
jgi:predicted esterase